MFLLKLIMLCLFCCFASPLQTPLHCRRCFSSYNVSGDPPSLQHPRIGFYNPVREFIAGTHPSSLCIVILYAFREWWYQSKTNQPLLIFYTHSINPFHFVLLSENVYNRDKLSMKKECFHKLKNLSLGSCSWNWFSHFQPMHLVIYLFFILLSDVWTSPKINLGAPGIMSAI